MALVALISVIGCSKYPGIPKPISVLENPTTGEGVRLFKEIWYKVPKDYDEGKYVAEWTAKHKKIGFTREVSPNGDRAQWAALLEKNQAARQQQPAVPAG